MHAVSEVFSREDQPRRRTKQAMLELWYRAARRGGAGSPPLTVFARGGDDRNWVLTRLIESFISLKPNNEKFVAYNRYTLPHFYGLVELAVGAADATDLDAPPREEASRHFGGRSDSRGRPGNRGRGRR